MTKQGDEPCFGTCLWPRISGQIRRPPCSPHRTALTRRSLPFASSELGAVRLSQSPAASWLQGTSAENFGGTGTGTARRTRGQRSYSPSLAVGVGVAHRGLPAGSAVPYQVCFLPSAVKTMLGAGGNLCRVEGEGASDRSNTFDTGARGDREPVGTGGSRLRPGCVVPADPVSLASISRMRASRASSSVVRELISFFLWDIC